jgi:3-oxoacyl-[acyl-carrier protein] reductase
MPDTGLEGAVALVTGGGSGLGAAISRRLAASGAHVVVNDVDPAAAEAVAGEVDGTAAPFDVSDSRAFDIAVDDAAARQGRLDIVVNNAGIVHHRQAVADRAMAAQMARMAGQPIEPVAATSTLPDDAWDRVIRVHLYGTFYGVRAALRHMEPVRRGAIVNLASIYGLRGGVSNAEYTAAKHGIVGLTRSVGLEVAPLGIRVNAVAPGFIDTPLLSPFDDTFKQLLTTQIGSGRLGHPEEVAEIVRFLAGPESSYCFGEVLSLTGAYD